MSFNVRLAHSGDLPILLDFNLRLAWETEGKRLDPKVLERGIARLLADPGRGLYYVAETSGDVVGQVMLTYEWSDWRDGWIWWLQSVYVRESHRRQRVFRQLLTHVVDQARQQGDVVGLRLYVERSNFAAQKAYRHWGFDEMPFLLLGRGLDPLSD